MWVIEEGELECFKKIGDEDRFALGPRRVLVSNERRSNYLDMSLPFPTCS